MWGLSLDGHKDLLADIETLPHEETPSFFFFSEIAFQNLRSGYVSYVYGSSYSSNSQSLCLSGVK